MLKNLAPLFGHSTLLAESSEIRNRLINHLRKEGVPTAIYYKKIFSELDIYKNLDNMSCIISKNISDRIFSIPMHPYLTNNDLKKITNSINTFFSKNDRFP